MDKNLVKELYRDMKRCLIARPAKILRLAVLKVKLLESMQKGFSYFTYEKQNGEIRETIATLDKELTPQYKFKGGKNIADNEALLITAWDSEKCMWRTFRVDRVKKMHV